MTGHPDVGQKAAAISLISSEREPVEPITPMRLGRNQERAWLEQALVVFTVVYGTGLRRGEILGLRWRHVRLADPAGPTMRVEETFVRDRVDTPKSDASERTIALGPVVADLLFEHRARTAFNGDDDRVFCHPETGGPMSSEGLRGHVPGSRWQGEDHEARAPVPRRPPRAPDERRRRRRQPGRAAGPGGPRRHLDNAAVYRPGRRPVP